MKTAGVVFFASASYLCKQYGMSTNSTNKIFQKNALLVYHGLLNKLDEDEVPEQMLRRSKAIGANSENKKHRMVNFYSLPSYTTAKLEEIEGQARKWKEYGYTMKGISREMFYRGEGKEVADKIYLQFKKVTVDGVIKDRTTSAYSDEKTQKIVVALHEILNKRGYVTEKDIIYCLGYKYAYHTTEEQIKRSLKEILDSYGLQRVRANKVLKEKYKVNSGGYPFIIIRCDDAEKQGT